MVQCRRPSPLAGGLILRTNRGRAPVAWAQPVTGMAGSTAPPRQARGIDLERSLGRTGGVEPTGAMLG